MISNIHLNTSSRVTPAVGVAPVSHPVSAKVKASKDIAHEASSNLKVPAGIHSEGLGLANIKKHVVARVLESVATHYDPLQFRQDVKKAELYSNKRIRRNARAIAANNNALRRYIRRIAKGSSAYELALLHAIAKIQQEDNQLQHLGYNDDILVEHIRNREKELQAYLNISSILQDHRQLASIEELAGAYETIVITTTSAFSALNAMIKRFGVDKMHEWAPFLTKAVVADLIAQPQGGDKIQLMHILLELKNFRILNTLKAFLEKLRETRLRHVSFGQALMTSLDMAEQPLTTMSVIEKWVQACSTEEQILFFQDYRNLFGGMSSEAFNTQDQQRNVKVTLQKKIDYLIYNSD